MPERLSIPQELQFLLEKREPSERRKGQRRSKVVATAKDRRSGLERRKVRSRRRKSS